VELYDTEEQQVEAIKNWWQENGKAVIVGTVVGLAAILGWNYYQSSVKAAQVAASHQYSDVVASLSQQGLDAEKTVQNFIEQHSDSNYAVLAAMQLAKSQIEAKHLDEGLDQLEWARAHTDDKALDTLIDYRVARIQAEQGNYESAEASLKQITDAGWVGRVAELKGDIALRQGNKEAAYVAYTEAQQAEDASQTLQMKLDDLAK
jgi:predicted negative regulator of RcsB-dependent stress response